MTRIACSYSKQWVEFSRHKHKMQHFTRCNKMRWTFVLRFIENFSYIFVLCKKKKHWEKKNEKFGCVIKLYAYSCEILINLIIWQKKKVRWVTTLWAWPAVMGFTTVVRELRAAFDLIDDQFFGVWGQRKIGISLEKNKCL